MARSTRRSAARWALLGAAAMAIGACKSGDDSGAQGSTCSSVMACGGDVAGTWQVDGECLAIQSPFAEPECQRAVQHSTVTVSGTVAYVPSDAGGSAGTEQVDLQYDFSIDEVYSTACLAAIGLKDASPEACAGLQAYWTGPYAVTCSPQSNTCECSFDDQGTIHDSDTYTITGNQLVLASSGAVDFCRAGDSLVESSFDGVSTSRLTMHLAR